MRRRGPPGMWRLLAPGLLAWALAAWLVGYAPAAWWVLAALTAATVATGVLAVLAPRAARAVCRYGLVGAAVLLVLAARLLQLDAMRHQEELVAAAQLRHPLTAEATLAGFPEPVAGGAAGGAERAWVRADLDTAAGDVPVLLWLPAEADGEPPGATERGWGPGTRVAVTGRLEALEPASSAAYAVSVSDAADLARTQTRITPAALSGRIAAELRERLRAATTEVTGAELVAGFAVGDTSRVTAELDEQMLASSLTHLTAVSGSNCALVITAVVWAASWLGAGRRLRIVLAACGLGGFIIVVGPDASVQRAAVMAAVMLVSDFGGRRGAGLPALGVAVIVLIVADPWQAREPGFTLSVAATAGIMLLGPPLERGLRRALRLPRPLALPIAVAIAAQVACGPLLLLMQEGIPVAGVLANVIAAPAAPMGTAAGLAALLLLPFWPAAGLVAVTVSSFATRWVAATAEVTAQLPGGRWHWPGGPGGALLLALCECALLASWAVLRGSLPIPRAPWRGPEPWGRGPRRGSRRGGDRQPLPIRWIAAVLACAGLGTAAAVILVVPAADRIGTPQDWAIVACDVGQGDAILLRDPAEPDRVMLVDTGDDAQLLDACLARFDVARVALLVLTHDDRDHVGALDAVADRTDAALIAPRTREQLGGERPVERRLEAAGVPWRAGAAGMRGGAGAGGPAWEVLAPAVGETPDEANAASLVLRVAAGEVTALMLGDTGEAAHAALLRSGAALGADVVKVAHHGSKDADPDLLRAAAAEYAIISVGADNDYGHPAPATLEAIADAGSTALRTDELGAIALAPGAGAVEVWAERVPAPN